MLAAFRMPEMWHMQAQPKRSTRQERKRHPCTAHVLVPCGTDIQMALRQDLALAATSHTQQGTCLNCTTEQCTMKSVLHLTEWVA